MFCFFFWSWRLETQKYATTFSTAIVFPFPKMTRLQLDYKALLGSGGVFSLLCLFTPNKCWKYYLYSYTLYIYTHTPYIKFSEDKKKPVICKIQDFFTIWFTCVKFKKFLSEHIVWKFVFSFYFIIKVMPKILCLN